MSKEKRVIEDARYDKHGRGNLTSNAMKETIVSVIAGLLLFTTVQACDVRIHMMHNTVTAICEGSECKRPPSSITLRHGQEICLEDQSGERLSMQLIETMWRFRYELAYYTSDYTDRLNTASACCGNLGCYDERTNCTSLAKSAVSEKYGSDAQVIVTCVLDGLRFASCAYQLERVIKGELSNLLRLKRNGVSVESIKFILKMGNESQLITMRDFGPANELNLSKFKLQHINSISITVIKGHITVGFDSRSALLEYDNKLYYVNSSEIREPADNLIGDFQIHLNKQGKDYVNKARGTICTSNRHCGCECSFPSTESTMSKFSQQRDSFKQPVNAFVKRNDSSVVIDVYETHVDDSYELELLFGDWEMFGFHLMKGKCDVTYVGSYGCSSCNQSAYFVFTAQNIKNDGFMPFQSNCSFNRNSIKCDYEPTKLVLKENHDTCYIKLLNSKKKFLVNMKYIHFGPQVPPEQQPNCTESFKGYGEILVQFVTGSQFLKTSATTMLGFLVFGLIAYSTIQCSYKRKRQLCLVEKEANAIEL